MNNPVNGVTVQFHAGEDVVTISIFRGYGEYHTYTRPLPYAGLRTITNWVSTSLSEGAGSLEPMLITDGVGWSWDERGQDYWRR